MRKKEERAMVLLAKTSVVCVCVCIANEPKSATSRQKIAPAIRFYLCYIYSFVLSRACPLRRRISIPL